jgi:hypothetical protein
MNKIVLILVAIALSCFCRLTRSSDLEQTIADWEVANFALEDEAQKAAFDALLERAHELRSNPMATAKEFLWAGIIESSYAGEIGGLSALGHAKQAKLDFESALAMTKKPRSSSKKQNRPARQVWIFT